MNQLRNVPFYTEYLSNELNRRKQNNSRYSLRAFARQLGLDASALSRILAGKQNLSVQGCLKIVEKLEISDQELNLFLNSVADEKKRRVGIALERGLQGPLLSTEGGGQVIFKQVSGLETGSNAPMIAPRQLEQVIYSRVA